MYVRFLHWKNCTVMHIINTTYMYVCMTRYVIYMYVCFQMTWHWCLYNSVSIIWLLTTNFSGVARISEWGVLDRAHRNWKPCPLIEPRNVYDNHLHTKERFAEGFKAKAFQWVLLSQNTNKSRNQYKIWVFASLHLALFHEARRGCSSTFRTPLATPLNFTCTCTGGWGGRGQGSGTIRCPYRDSWGGRQPVSGASYQTQSQEVSQEVTHSQVIHSQTGNQSWL